jgi:phosphopantetheine--protein transferase-like protein
MWENDFLQFESIVSRTFSDSMILEYCLYGKREGPTESVGNAAIEQLYNQMGFHESTGHFTIRHDDYGAPFVASDLESELPLLSLADEGNSAYALAAIPSKNFLLAGVGIDVATVSDFQGDDENAELLHRLFSAQEYMAISGYPRSAQPAQKALYFSAKEAALKSLAPIIRDWNNRQNQEKVTIDFTEFETCWDGSQGYVLPRDGSKGIGRILDCFDITLIGYPGKTFTFTAAKAARRG